MELLLVPLYHLDKNSEVEDEVSSEGVKSRSLKDSCAGP